MSQKTLDKLYAKATAAATAPSGKTALRATIALPADHLATVGDMIGVHALAKAVTEELDALKAQAAEAVFAAFTEQWFDEKTKPANPRLAVRDARGDHDTIYQMRDTPLLHALMTPDMIVEGLAAGDDGLTTANELVQAEIVLDPCLRMRYTLSELVDGHREMTESGSQFVPATEAERVLAEKILTFLTHAGDKKGKVTIPGLTADERAFLLVKDNRLKFRDPKGFFTRILSYVTTLPQLRRVLAVFAPVQMFSPMHFAADADLEDRQRGLLSIAQGVLGLGGD